MVLEIKRGFGPSRRACAVLTEHRPAFQRADRTAKDAIQNRASFMLEGLDLPVLKAQGR